MGGPEERQNRWEERQNRSEEQQVRSYEQRKTAEGSSIEDGSNFDRQR